MIEDADVCGDRLAMCVCTNPFGCAGEPHRCTRDDCLGTWEYRNGVAFPLTLPTGETFYDMFGFEL